MNTRLKLNGDGATELFDKIQLSRSDIQSENKFILQEIKRILQNDNNVGRIIHPDKSNKSFDDRKKDRIEFLVDGTVGVIQITGAIGSGHDRDITELTLSARDIDDIVDGLVTDPDEN